MLINYSCGGQKKGLITSPPRLKIKIYNLINKNQTT